MAIMNKLEKNNNINTMILCAGKGQRMRYKTKYIAKPLIKIQNKPILKTNVKYLSSIGIKNCIINNSYKHLTIQKFIKNYSYKYTLPKMYSSFEKERLETGGGVKKVLSIFNKNKILIINGDSLLLRKSNSCPVKKLFKSFNSNFMSMLLLLAPINKSIGYYGRGDFIIKSNSITSRIERKKNNKSHKSFVFTGWQIIDKDLFNDIKKDNFSLNLLYDKAQRQNSLFAVTLDGYFLHVSTPKSIIQIERFLNVNKKYLNEKNYIL
jgi:MurNAc alpha-1-phosphate uridylyltransferase